MIVHTSSPIAIWSSTSAVSSKSSRMSHSMPLGQDGPAKNLGINEPSALASASARAFGTGPHHSIKELERWNY
jgi:hypothetical protein